MGWTAASLLLALAIGALRAGPAAATDFWVKNGGNDAADGLSVATAWATLGHAAAVVNPGDTVHVLDGSYQGFDLRRAGAPGQPITFKAEGNAVAITADNGTTTDGINVEDSGYVVIDGFIVDNRTRNGIRVALSPFVTVRNCHTGFNGSRGIFTGFADDLLIENNEAHHSVAEHGIYTSNSGDRPVIRGNLVHDNHAAGIHMNGDLSQGGDGTISGALVERNVIYGNGAGGGSGINMDGVTDSVVRNNLLYDNHASGISLFRIDGATGSSRNNVVDNTIVNASNSRWCVNINTGSTGNTVLNNILYNQHATHGVIIIDASSRTGFVSDYNSVMDRFSTTGGPNGTDTVITFAAWQAEGYDAHSFLATPADLFVIPGVDFHLKPGSPAVDTGTSLNAPAIDLEGNPRPVGAGFDVGAYEQQLSHCGDGTVDPGEQCGEPGLADCAGGQACQGCRCVNVALCQSGIGMIKPFLKLRASPFLLRLKGGAAIPKPWQVIDPAANGVRIRVDAPAGPGGVDALIPGGSLWRVNARGTVWTYRDPTGSQAGIVRVVVRDRSQKQDGLVRWVVAGKGGTAVLPAASAVRAAVVVGAPLECAALVFNPPGGTRPRCDGGTVRLTCH